MAADPPSNDEIVAFLRRLAALMEFRGDKPFGVRAYDNAARILAELEVDIVEMSAAGTLTDLEGIGKGVAGAVAEFIETGTASAYRKLTDTIPESLLDLLRIPGLGTKKVKAIYEALGIATLEALAAACQEDRLDELPGFGAKTQDSILKGIARLERYQGQYRLDQALTEADLLVDALGCLPQTTRVSVAGSLRRRKEIVKDVDIVLSTESPAEVADAFASLPQVDEVLSKGDRKVAVRLRDSGIQVDLRLVADEHYATMLHHFTGSKDHNVGMRSRALARDLHLNEYGLYHGRKGDGERLDTADEGALFAALGLSGIPPELREGLGEIETAEADQLPELLTAGDLRGLVHVHTRASDGQDSLQEMVEAVRQRGFEYVCVCDHSQAAGPIYGMQADDARRQQDEIDALQAERDDIRILKGVEADIMQDGSLDYDDELLASFDLVVAAVHNRMGMNEAALTKRVVTALEHPATKVLAHPTSRLLLQREGHPLNLEEIVAAAAANGVALELNTQPQRLDLDWRWLRRARDAGALIVIAPDAHCIAELDHLELGVGVARKGWLTAADVINTSSTDQLLAWARA